MSRPIQFEYEQSKGGCDVGRRGEEGFMLLAVVVMVAMV